MKSDAADAVGRGNRRVHVIMKTVLAMAVVAFATAQAAGLKDGELTPLLGHPKQEQRYQFGMIVYVNGQYTTADEARRDATVVAERVNSPVQLVYNDLTWHFVDWFSTVIEKVGTGDSSVNAATKTLIEYSRERIEQGDSIYLIGHSAGSLSILNAVRAVERAYRSKLPAERKILLSRIHVLTVGSATFNSENLFADGWPESLGSVHHLYNIRDGVANVWGEGDIFDWFDCDLGDYHSMAGHYAKQIRPNMLSCSGSTVIRP